MQLPAAEWSSKMERIALVEQKKRVHYLKGMLNFSKLMIKNAAHSFSSIFHLNVPFRRSKPC